MSAIAPINSAPPISPALFASSHRLNAPVVQAPSLKEQFDQTLGTLFYGELVKSLRKTVGKPAYLHGGQAEDMFQSQLDQHVVDRLAKSAPLFSGALFERFAAGKESLSPEQVTAASPTQTLPTVNSPNTGPAAQPVEPLQPAEPDRSRKPELSLQALLRARNDSEGAIAATGTTDVGWLIRK